MRGFRLLMLQTSSQLMWAWNHSLVAWNMPAHSTQLPSVLLLSRRSCLAFKFSITDSSSSGSPPQCLTSMACKINPVVNVRADVCTLQAMLVESLCGKQKVHEATFKNYTYFYKHPVQSKFVTSERGVSKSCPLSHRYVGEPPTLIHTGTCTSD